MNVASQIQVILITLFFVACGTDFNPRSIDDGPGASSRANVTSEGPIHSPGGWHSTIAIYVAADVPDAVEEATMAVISSWNNAVEREIMYYAGRIDVSELDSLYGSLSDNQTIIYHEPNWRQVTGKSNGVLGTTVWENDRDDGSVIAKGDIILNAEAFVFQDATEEAVDADRVYDVADAESVLLHETGHLIGLDHVSSDEDPDSIMHPKATVGLNVYRRQISSGDAELAQSIYK